METELKQSGIAITSLDQLIGNQTLFNELSDAVEGLELQQSAVLAEKKAAANCSEAVGQKTFNVELLGSFPRLQPGSIFARFALQRPILDVANAYFGMYTRLRYYNVWHTFATQVEPRESQLWHRDREDHRILKIFVYMSNVDDGGGPFTYAAGSHRKSVRTREPQYFLETGVKRSTDEQMNEVVGRDKWISATGKKGTIVFADTSGFHKGGLARHSDRIMYLCMFTSKASQSKELFVVPGQFEAAADRAVSFALSQQQKRVF